MFSDSIFYVLTSSGENLGVKFFGYYDYLDVEQCQNVITRYLDSHDDYDDLRIVLSKSEPLYFGTISGYVGYHDDFVYTDEDGVERDPIVEGNDAIFECKPIINCFGQIDFEAI